MYRATRTTHHARLQSKDTRAGVMFQTHLLDFHIRPPISGADLLIDPPNLLARCPNVRATCNILERFVLRECGVGEFRLHATSSTSPFNVQHWFNTLTQLLLVLIWFLSYIMPYRYIQPQQKTLLPSIKKTVHKNSDIATMIEMDVDSGLGDVA
ncbi:hypothetical protein MSAN_02029100 [Mycena sanguinolenta]|uniref:Uncharacterized protein n=1 Tax=Mycena sanguinolenta TaxID=230812 RepID=A0A8H6XLM6_9AGAR|nr:hypothetical protein MSAN_02029100 [Mycena sanguinolenta]